jgi:hypothetical protein
MTPEEIYIENHIWIFNVNELNRNYIKYENDGLDDKERYNVIIDKMFMHIFGALLVLIVNFILKSLFI